MVYTHYLLGSTLFLLSFLVYYNTLEAGYVWDDRAAIVSFISEMFSDLQIFN